MGTVTAFTAERSQQIEDQAIVDGEIVGDDLVLTKNNGTLVNAGNVRGPQGVPGPPGGLGEAPIDGPIYGRKEEAWVQIPAAGTEEAPVDGGQYGVYARYNAAWVRAPGTLLGEEFNATDSATALSSAVSMAGDGTKVTVPVGVRGVTVDFGALLGHSQAGKFVGVHLYVDGVVQVRGKTLEYIVVAGSTADSSRKATFPAGELSVGNHTFEVKAKQGDASASMLIHESWISVRAN